MPQETQLGLYYAYNTPMVGASGAVFGLLAAFAWLFPNTKLMLLFPPIPIKAKWFVLMYAGLEIYLGFRNSAGDSVAHFAHIGGALVGVIMLLIWQRNRNKFY
jgi:membrane associated rhomboid family serine protease